MKTILTTFTNITLFKWAFGYACVAEFANVVTQNGTETGDFVDNILNTIPSQVTVYLGIVYGVTIILIKLSNAWKTHYLNRYEVKTAKENYHIKEIEVDKLENETENDPKDGTL